MLVLFCYLFPIGVFATMIRIAWNMRHGHGPGRIC